MGCHPLGRAGAAAVCACAAPAASRISASHPRTTPLVVRPTSPPPETWSGWDSNPRPPGCKPGALPAELPPRSYKLAGIKGKVSRRTGRRLDGETPSGLEDRVHRSSCVLRPRTRWASRRLGVCLSVSPSRDYTPPCGSSSRSWSAVRSSPVALALPPSGSHVKELALWQAAGVTPASRWRIESGADQAATLHLADERDAYALADLPTYAKLRDLSLRILFVADTALTNPYTVYVTRHASAPPTASAFARWTTQAGRVAIVGFRLPDAPPPLDALPGGALPMPTRQSCRPGL